MNYKRNEGVTLIVLIITVIILLVLAGVSIGIVVNDGLFDKAKDTVKKANSQSENEGNQKEEIKNVWEAYPGKVLKSTTKKESTIEFSVVTDIIERDSFRIYATGTNADNEILTYILILEDETAVISEATQTGSDSYGVYWDITNLKPGKGYRFEVIARDDYSENNIKGRETTKKNNKPTLNVTSEPQPTTAKIIATGEDTDGDTLTYTLEINGTTQTNNTGTFNVLNLSEKTQYTYTVTVTDGYDEVTQTNSLTTTSSNTAPKVTVKERNLAPTTVTIVATGSDADGDTLTYTLEINGTTQTNNTGTFSVKNLTAKTPYTYTVTVSDGTLEGTATGTFTTWCTGEGTPHDATVCTAGYEYYPCDVCGGTTQCTSTSYQNAYLVTDSSGTTSSIGTCSICGYPRFMLLHFAECTVCYGEIELYVCSGIWSHQEVSSSHYCGSCVDGYYSVEGYCSEHGYEETHYICGSGHSYVGTESTCPGACEHGQTDPHAI